MTRILFFTWRAVLRRYGDVVKALVHGGHEVVIWSPVQVHRRLPGEFRELLTGSPSRAEPFGVAEFVHRVADREGVDGATAERHVRAVFIACFPPTP